MVSLSDVQRAQAAISGFVRSTPLIFSASLSTLFGFPLYLKAENAQRAGSFKIRGAFFRLSNLTDAERQHGVVAASAGNHAQGVALAAQQIGVAATIVMPEGAPITKVEATENYGAKVVLHGSTYEDAQALARKIQKETGATFIHGFADPFVIAGQGTVAVEIIDEIPDVNTILVPIGGGGLVSGVALAAKALRPDIRVVGVQAAGAPAVFLAKQQGKYVKTAAVRTIADGIAIKEPGRLNWEYIQRFVDDVVVVDEEDIGHGILVLLERAKQLVEGAGAVGVAALLAGKVPAPKGPVAVVLSGGNIDVNILSRIIERGLVRAGRYIRLGTFVVDRPGGLQRLLATVAAAGANVISVNHQRWLDKVTVGEVEIELALETRNATHVQELIGVLQRDGYQVRQIPPFRPGTEP